MLLGVTITPAMLIGGGSALLVLSFFQVLQGLRKIRFKGRMHLTVHKGVAFVLLAGMCFHGTAALAYLGIIGG